jgi:hypothetical protein
MDHALMPRLRPHPVESRKAAQAWAAAFIRNHKDGRFECEPGLGVAELLQRLGYTVRPVNVEVYEIDLA